MENGFLYWLFGKVGAMINFYSIVKEKAIHKGFSSAQQNLGTKTMHVLVLEEMIKITTIYQNES